MILLYLLIVSSGLGYGEGFGAGVGGEHLSGPWAFYGEANYIDQQKHDRDGHRLGALLEGRYGRKWFALAGASVSHTETDRWSKTGWRPVVGAGVRQGPWQAVLRGYLPDSTDNDLSGARVQIDYRRAIFARVSIGFWSFDGGRTDQTAAIALGWSWS